MHNEVRFVEFLGDNISNLLGQSRKLDPQRVGFNFSFGSVREKGPNRSIRLLGWSTSIKSESEK